MSDTTKKIQIKATTGTNTYSILHPETIASQVLLATTGTDTVATELTRLQTEMDNLLTNNDALIFKGIVDSTTALPDGSTAATQYKQGWTYKVGSPAISGTFSGKACEVGDLVICINDWASTTTDQTADWVVVQSNIDGAVVGTSESNASGKIAVFDGSGYKLKVGDDNILLPTQTNNAGKILSTNGSTASWVPIESVYIKKGKKYLYEVTEDYASGLTITLPSTPTDYGYTVGNDEFDVYMGGAKLTSNQYTEVGTTGTTSHSVTIPGYVPNGHDIEICFVPSLVINS